VLSSLTAGIAAIAGFSFGLQQLTAAVAAILDEMTVLRFVLQI